MGTNYYQSNNAIQSTSEDIFNFTPYAKKIQEAIRLSGKSDEPMIFGVYGKWGEGKSSFLNLIFKDLEAGVASDSKKIIKFKFNPWRYQSEDKMLLEFFNALIKVINNDYGSNDKKILINVLKKYCASVLAGTKVEVEKGVNLGIKYTVKTAYSFNETFDYLKNNKKKESLEEQKTSIDDILKKHNYRIVIFLDDIDRLNKRELYLIFRLLKLIASFRNITYIVALDNEMVSKAIYKNYGDDISDGEKYLEKIVNIPIVLPKVEPQIILNELKKGLTKIFSNYRININELKSETTHDYNTGVNRFFREIYGLENHLTSPRMLNRLLNSFSTNMIALKSEVNYADLIWLELLRIKYLKVYNYVKNHPHFFKKHGTIDGLVGQNAEILNEGLKKLINSKKNYLKDDIELIKIILNKLFPVEHRGGVVSDYLFSKDESYKVKIDSELSIVERRINNSEYFKTYFNYNTSGRISNIELDALLKLIIEQDNSALEAFNKFLSSNDKGKFFYEVINRIKQTQKNDKRYNLIYFFLKHLDSLVYEIEGTNIFNKTSRNQIVEDLFSNASILDKNQLEDITINFIGTADIVDIMYSRRALYNEEFKNSSLQKKIDSEIIKKIKEKYTQEPFFSQFENHETRAIFSIWSELNPKEFQKYMSKHINKNTIASLIKCFPTIWNNGSNGSYLDDFVLENYKFLKLLFNPKIAANIISKEFSEDLKNPKYNSDEIWKINEDKDDLMFLAQFMFHYNNDLKKTNP
ncbi:hypothetical protein H0I29_12090 [Polaribacter sp. R2A056_3_33]|uniref:KAP family P-loop NTPase fold protein n=1 Tax=Polaribacter sp. R2A056_3_33 TaxID=2745563 RepID=UPI001C4F17F4|nr:P-loop NTPase fold protein [Polaribacter sp. R2A056_3_33]QXP69364.1 hypothetical protein H0I29_12090 [Polaribacter sp. R2A056_3_33]